MITKTELRNDRYQKGICMTSLTTDRFNRMHLVESFVGTTFRYNYPNENCPAPYDVITRLSKYTVHLYAMDYQDKSVDFDNLEDAINYLYDHNHKYAGTIYQWRKLSNGEYDTTVVTYITHLPTDAERAQIL